MILFKKETHEIVIVDFNKSTQSIIYDYYTNPLAFEVAKLERKALANQEVTDLINSFDTTVLNGQSRNEFAEQEIYNYILSLPEFAGFELLQSDWVHSTRTMRLFIDDVIVKKAKATENDFYTVMTDLAKENINATEKFIFVEGVQTVVYVNDIQGRPLTEEDPILEGSHYQICQEYLQAGTIKFRLKPI